MMKALFPGTFNPPTLGHLDVIERAAALFDFLYIGIAEDSPKKEAHLTIAEKKKLLKQITKPFNNVEVVVFPGLVADYALQLPVDCIIRGLRSASDYEYETQMAAANHMMTGIETIFISSDSAYANLSSSLIREIASHGKRLHGFVPESIEALVFQKFKPGFNTSR